MQKKLFEITSIPALLWGDDSERVILTVHGSGSNKADAPIALLAEQAAARGYQVLSFDLPEHGDRKDEGTLCTAQRCVLELGAVMRYARANWAHIFLFGNSIGAYFSLLAYQNESVERAWLLSPVVDMRRVIETMMLWFGVTEECLARERRIPTPIGQTLDWDYYCYVKAHRVSSWTAPTHILYGSADSLCEFDTISSFAASFSCGLTVVEGTEHYFHTPEQLRALTEWLAQTL